MAANITTKYMRPPYGDYDDRVRGIAAQLGYKIVSWDRDTNDWTYGDDHSFNLEWIEGNFTEWVKEPSETGHISLEHDLYEQTADRAPLVVPIVQNAGFTIKPVAVCLNDPKPYVEDVSLTNSTINTNNNTQANTVENNSTVESSTPSVENSAPNETNEPSYPDDTKSNAISFTKNNSNLMLLVCLIVGSFMII